MYDLPATAMNLRMSKPSNFSGADGAYSKSSESPLPPSEINPELTLFASAEQFMEKLWIPNLPPLHPAYRPPHVLKVEYHFYNLNSSPRHSGAGSACNVLISPCNSFLVIPTDSGIAPRSDNRSNRVPRPLPCPCQGYPSPRPRRPASRDGPRRVGRFLRG
jgi:hypothetical protein